MTVKLQDLKLPIAVWKAVEGERVDLISLLRGDAPLNRPTRNALADWLEGTLRPVELGRGRPKKISYFIGDHDVNTNIGWAAVHFESTKKRLRSHGFHKKSAGKFYWSNARLHSAIAKRYQIDVDTFINYLKRGNKCDQASARAGLLRDMEDCRREIALKIRRAKTSEVT